MKGQERSGQGARGAGHRPGPSWNADPTGRDAEDDGEEGVIVRDLRTDERYWAHDALIDDYAPLLGVDGFAVYSSLCLMANRAQFCWPSLARLARHWGKGKSTVSRAISLMTDLRLIHVKRTERVDGGTGNNVYYLLEPLPLADALAALFDALLRAKDTETGVGLSPEEAGATVLDLVPASWEPLRPRKAAFAARSDLEAYMQALVARSLPGRGASLSGTGSPERERGTIGENGAVPEEDGGSLEGEQGWSSVDAGAIPPRDSKVDPNQGRPIKETQMNHHHPPESDGGGPGIVIPIDEVAAYSLGDDEVLLDAGDECAQVVSLYNLVCSDVRASQNTYLPISTEPYYSTAHFCGTNEEAWTVEERARIARHGSLRQEVEALHREIGACSLEEALAGYFTADLILRYAMDEPRERGRVQGWLCYVASAGGSLTNPAGFLRTRLASGQWPPRADLAKGVDRSRPRR